MMDTLSVSAMAVKRNTVSSRGASVRTGSSMRLLNNAAASYRMDESMASITKEITPIFSKLKPTRCYRPKEWTPAVEEGGWVVSLLLGLSEKRLNHNRTRTAFRVQQTGWRDVKEYMETYGHPDRWDNGFIRCTRVKSNGYYTYWYVHPVYFHRLAESKASDRIECRRAYRECDDKYLHTVKVFEYE